MTGLNITNQRLLNQHLASPVYTSPADTVHYMGAIQAQDYAGAKWAIALRSLGATDALVESAFTDGDIIRTHVMRPTWHFVSPRDVRWMLELTAPRVQGIAAFRHRQLNLDQDIFRRCEKALAKALTGGKHLSRDEVTHVLQQAGIATDEQRFVHIMMQMELIGLVCSGGRLGKQFSYTLLDERVPAAKALDRRDALAMLAERYFTAHGPATLQDFAWWSGLSVTDSKAGLEMLKHKLVNEISGGNTYWFAQQVSAPKSNSPIAFLLPNYDEYIVSYKDRSAAIASTDINKTDPRGTIFNHTILINGRIAGTWKRSFRKDTVFLEIAPFAPLSKANHAAILAAAKRYTKFLGLKDFKLQP
ncbi:MAG: winged helix DNA-binding protein [Mucilaginibacter sp.]|nr:winged helix DNA-binding protein [Mucilaginibacter sp.]